MDDHARAPGAPGQRIPALDALRGAAILAVFLHHAAPGAPTVGAERFLLGAFHLGWAGVDLFFVLSGFLITGILLDTRDRPGYFRRFYARRARRIFPLYYVTLALIILALPLLGGIVKDEAHIVALRQEWLWTYANNIKIAMTARWSAAYADHFWTLAVEEQFYLVWPFVVLLSTPQRLARTCVLIAALALISRVVLVVSGSSPLAVTVFTLTRADSLALGALPACLLRMPNGADLLRRLIPRAMVLGGGVAAAIAAADVAGFVGPWWAGRGAAWATVGYSALGVLFTAVVARAALGTPVAPQSRAFRFLRLTGVYSYGFYVMHAPVLYVLRDAGWHPTDWRDFLAYGATAFVIAYALAAMSWHWFESRILQRQASPVRALGLQPIDA
jgi:peptidoglycan/LPS O-acetylase OafA/YrhL